MRKSAPAVARNREPLLEVLRPRIAPGSRVLEIAAGTGEHALYFTQKLDLHWIPTDPDPEAVASIAAWRTEGPERLAAPRQLSVLDEDWPAPVDAVVCINMVHISPWECSEALFAGAGRVLSAGGRLLTYGPYRIDGEQTAPSNTRFEGWLKSLDPRYGVRDMADLEALGLANSLALTERIAMPANNFVLVFERG